MTVSSASGGWNPFAARLPERNGLWRSLLGLRNPANAFVDLNNELAAAARVQDVTLDSVERINAEYGIDMHAKCSAALEEAYAGALRQSLRDRKFSQQEVDGLRHIQSLFGIGPSRVRAILKDVGARSYESTLKDALRDSSVTGAEKAFLDRLSRTFELPEDVTRRIYAEQVTGLVQGRVNAALSDAMLSPQEEEDLHAIARGLGAAISYAKADGALLAKCRMMWQIRHGELPEIDAGISLQRGERCHLMTPATWNEMRRVRVASNWGGPSLRFRIAKGVYWNVGQYRSEPIMEDKLVRVDSGTVFITSKRVIFTGPMRSASMRVDRILDIVPYADGVGIQKDTGKSPLYGFTANIDVFCAVLARVIADSG